MKSGFWSKTVIVLVTVPLQLTFSQLSTEAFINVTGDPNCPCLREFTHLNDTRKNENGTCVYPFFPSDLQSTQPVCYPPSYGISCGTHDLGLEPYCGNLNEKLEDFCYGSFCYIDPNKCISSDLIFTKSSYFPSLYYSYSTCNDSNTWQDFAVSTALKDKFLRVGTPQINYPDQYKLDEEGNPIFFGDTDEGIGDWKGFFVDYLEEISKLAGFSYEFFPVSKGSIANNNGDVWNACVQDVGNEILDICLGDFWETTSRAKLAQFTTAISHENMYMMISRPAKGGFFSDITNIFRPFTLAMWIMMCFLVLCVGHTYAFLIEHDGEEHKKLTIFGWIVDKMYYTFLEILGGVDLPEKKNSAQRIVVLGWSFFVVIFISAYTANLAAFLSASTLKYKYSSIEDCVSKNCVVCSMKSATLTGALLAKYKDIDLDESYDGDIALMEGWNNGNCDALVVGDITWIVTQDMWGDCETTFHGPSAVSFKIGWPSSKKVARTMSYWVKKTTDEGLYDDIFESHSPKQSCIALEEPQIQDDDVFMPEPIDIKHMLGPIVIVYVGIVLGFIAKYVEPFAKKRVH